MLMLLSKEWREFRRAPWATVVHTLTGLVALAALPRPWSVWVALAIVSLIGVTGTARRVWRERWGGGLPRLALTPLPPHSVVTGRILARSAGLALQFLPLLAVAAIRSAESAQTLPVAHTPPGPWHLTSWSLAGAATMAGSLVTAAAAGTLVGLRARRRGQLYLWSIGAAAALWLAGLPGMPGRGLGPLHHAGIALMGQWAAGSLPLAVPAGPLGFAAGVLALTAWLAPRLLAED